MSMNEKYSDIIHLPHPISEKHPRMPMLDRAAQFSPFAALTGYEEAIYETGRLTEEKTELGEEEKQYWTENSGSCWKNCMSALLSQSPTLFPMKKSPAADMSQKPGISKGLI